ncbi:hypothetical protein KDA_42170 [Dictyobacter alpinus]|uniref:Pyrrolo-quinoline quinone repeat domain-containing protein n=1 Tax=Dictyobacter alpinus TaxID=2014873 RepID=A0A402BBG4_9CHLR|nr:PQQ-binding-like beta-propeller repeat protein [Dictyobacter alpinus]GCE28733.1 hypothetical protein KDA_42170 [Dictyobacter alpinus]
MADKEYFNPGIVDEQVDGLLQGNATPGPEARTARELQALYQSDLQSLERVWQRLDLGTDTGFGERPWLNNVSHHDTSSPHLERFRYVQGQHTQRKGTNSRLVLTRWFGLIAAVLVAALLVGSLIAFLNITGGSHHKSTISPPPRPTAPVVNAPNLQVKTVSGVYVGDDQYLTKNDPLTGKIIWRYDIKSATGVKTEYQKVYRIVPLGNTVFVLLANILDPAGAYEQRVVALNAQTGAVFWHKSLPDREPQDMIVADGTVYVSTLVVNTPTDKSAIYALDASKGSIKKSYTFSFASITMTWYAGNLYMGTSRGLYVMNAHDGKIAWQDQINVGNPFIVTRPQIVNGVVYVAFNYTSKESGVMRSFIRAYHAQTGANLWSTNELSNQVYDMTVSNQKLYFGLMHFVDGNLHAFGGIMYAYNIQNGKPDWSREIDGNASAAPAIANGVIYAPTYSGPQGKSCTITALDASTGQLKWKKPLMFGLAINPVVVNDQVYVAVFGITSNTGKLYAYKLDGTLAWEADHTQIVSMTAVA